MTLNNLAGGMAGGVVGMPPVLLAFDVLVASFVLMWIGHQLGRAVPRDALPCTPQVAAGCAFLLLAAWQIYQVIV